LTQLELRIIPVEKKPKYKELFQKNAIFNTKQEFSSAILKKKFELGSIESN
jgi:hypothetical protein